MVSPVTSPAPSTMVRGLAALSVAPQSLPPAQSSAAAPAHNPQGLALAQGQRMRRQLTVQAQKNAAIQDAEVWLAEATTHDLEAFLNKDLRDDYRQVFAQIKASIETGAKELTLKWSEVSHLPEAVLRHFSNFNFENLSRLTSVVTTLKPRLLAGSKFEARRCKCSQYLRVLRCFAPSATNFDLRDQPQF
jgi:hypothetical protein